MKGASRQDIKNQKEFNQEVENLTNYYGDLLQTQKQVNNERNEELRSTREISDEIRKQLGAVKENLDFKTATRRILKEINKLSEQNVDLSQEEKSLTLEVESIQKRQQKLAKTQLSLYREQRFVSSKIASIENDIEGAQGEQKEILEEQLVTFQRIERSLADQVDSSSSISKNLSQARNAAGEVDKLGVPKAFSFLSDLTSSIPGLRKLSGPFKESAVASKAMASRLTKANLQAMQMGKTKLPFSKSGIAIKSMGAGFKALGPILNKALGPLALVKMAADVVKFFFDAMVGASKATAEMSRNMLISRESARELYSTTIPGVVNQFNEIQKAAGNVSITIGAYEEALANINNLLGFQLNLTEDFGKQTAMNVAEVAKMSVNFGLSAEASKQLFLEAERSGEPLEDMNKSIFGTLGLMSAQSGLQIDINKTIEEAAKVSGNMRANFGGSTEAIAAAVFQSKLLGLSLSQLEGTASSLLDFQSSIENEMAAELLTGKQLNLEKAREAALMGDMDTLMKEISEQAGTQEEFLSMNIVQRQALAKAVGMEVNELADMYKMQAENDALAQKNLEIQNKLRKEGKSLLAEGFDIKEASLAEIRIAAQKAGKSEAELRDLLGEQIYARKQEEDATQKFNKALQQAKDAFTRLVDGGALDKLADILSGITESSLFSGFAEEGEAKRIADAAAESKDKNAIDQQKIANEALEAQTQATGTDDFTDALGAAAAGAVIGSIIPGIGTAVGAVVGGLIGGVGAMMKNQADQRTADVKLQKAQDLGLTSPAENVEDFILRPGKAPIKFRKDDVIVGGTNLGGNGNNTEIILNKILSAIENGGDVYMDGAKVGKSLVLSSSRMG